ncbi:putative Vacuolar protein-sorting-associated protein 60 (putative) [Pseudozyma hubeiensis]|nr:putative Vacuolar protein-sorting-associated protein 60 (putative) [Pseudozyma hubeiensis]
MNRLFGSKAAKPKPSLTDAIASTETRADSVEVKIRKLDSELTRYRDQMRKMRDGPGKTAIQQRALRVLKQKRLYENQLAQLQQQSYNMEQATMTTENLRNTMATSDAMQTANKEMKKIGERGPGETLGRSYGVPDEVDEEDLQAELDALEAEGGWEEEGGEHAELLAEQPGVADFVDELPNEGLGAGQNKEQEQALRAA